jgi:hypothetical protein
MEVIFRTSKRAEHVGSRTDLLVGVISPLLAFQSGEGGDSNPGPGCPESCRDKKLVGRL